MKQAVGRLPSAPPPLVNRARKRSRPSGRVSAIARSRYWHALDKFSVVLTDGRLGIGSTLEEAVEAARQPDAQNVLS